MTRDPPVKIGVFGAGAIGCYLGGRLAEKNDVILVGRERSKRELASGITLIDLNAKETRVDVRFETEAMALADRDVVLLGVKSAQTEEASRALKEVLPKNTVVASMQNGLRNAETMRGILTEKIVLGGIVGFNVVWQDGGRFRLGTSGLLAIEAHSDPRVEALATALRSAGFPTEVSTDIVGQQWSKLVMNLNNGISALSGAPTYELLFSPGYRRILRALIAESLAVMKRGGVRPVRLGPIPVRFFPTMLGLPTPILKLVARAQLKVDPEARSSMWEDLSKGRLTEVDYLNGEIVRLAEKCGALAPLNRKIIELVHAAEQAGKGSPGLGAEALWAALSA